MDHIVVSGVPPYDGRYEFDLSESMFKTREWGWIKKFSGYLPMTFTDGWRDADAELLSVFAIIALVRAGKLGRDEVAQAWERFGDAPGLAAVRLEFENATEEDDEQLPPFLSPSSSSNGATSGDDSRTSSEVSAVTPPVTGTPDSVTSVSRPAS